MSNARDLRKFNEFLAENGLITKGPMTKDQLAGLHIREMFNRTAQMFEWAGLPDSIPQYILELYLQTYGWAYYLKVKGTDYVFFGGLGGEPDEYYRPTECIITNPALNLSGSYKIDIDGVLIKNDTTMTGLLPIYRKYAWQLAENAISMQVADILARAPNIITAPNGTIKKAADAYIADIIDGRLSIVTESALTDNVIRATQFGAGGAQDLVPLMEYDQYLHAHEMQDIGLNENHNSKREALNSAEVGLNEDVLRTLPDDMLKCRQDACDKINKMYGTDIWVDFSSTWAVRDALTEDNIEDATEEVVENAEIDNADTSNSAVDE